MTEKSLQNSPARDNQWSPGVINMENLRFSIYLFSKDIQNILKNYGYRDQKSRQLYFKKHLDDCKICTNQSWQRHSTDFRRHFDGKTCASGLFPIENLSKKSWEGIVTESKKMRQLFHKQPFNCHTNCKTISHRVQSPKTRRLQNENADIFDPLCKWIAVIKLFWNFLYRR